MKFFLWNIFSKKPKQQPIEDQKPELDDLVEKCCENESKIEHNIDYMRRNGLSEEEVENTCKEMRKRFAQKYNLTDEELVNILLKVYEQQLIDEKKHQNDLIYELLAKEDIEQAEQNGVTGAELEALKFSKALEIQLLHSSNLESVDLYYGTIDQKLREEIEKYNDQVVFETCLRREVQLKAKNSSWDYKQITHYFESRMQSYLKGAFDYPKNIKDSMRAIIVEEDSDKPVEFRRLKNPEDIIKYQDRVDKKRATLPKVESEVLNKIYKK